MEKKTFKHPEIEGILTLIGSVLLLLCMLSFVHGNPKANWFGIIGYGIGFESRRSPSFKDFFVRGLQ